MIRINMIRSQVPITSDSRYYVNPRRTGASSTSRNYISQTTPDSTSALIPIPRTLGPVRTEFLLGKSPLRLIVARREVFDEDQPSHFLCWSEILECGHEVSEFCFVAPRSEPTAKRRRCQKCKAIEAEQLKASLPPKKPALPVEVAICACGFPLKAFFKFCPQCGSQAREEA